MQSLRRLDRLITNPTHGIPAALLAVLLTLTTLTGCTAEPEEPKVVEPFTKDGFTTPGRTLALGETARVRTPGGEVTFDLAVTGVVEGDSDDISRDVPNIENLTPYYVTYVLKVVEGEGNYVDMRRYLRGWVDDELLSEVHHGRMFPPCQRANIPFGSPPGTAVESCRTYVAAKESPPPDVVTFENDSEYEVFEGTELRWLVPQVN